MIKISVVMPVYKEVLSVIERSVESILNQKIDSYSLEFLIIVDNPNPHDSIIKYFEAISFRYDFVNIVYNDRNIGLPNSLNKAISLVSGDYVARMDADDISVPTRLIEQLNFIKKHGYDLVGSNIHNFVDKEQSIAMLNIRKPKKRKEDIYSGTLAFHPTWFVKRHVFEKINYRNLRYSQDIDFLFSCLKYGFRIGNVDKTLLLYNCVESSSNKRLQQFVLSNFIRLSWKQYDGDYNFILSSYENYNFESSSSKLFKSLDSSFLNGTPLLKVLISIISPLHFSILLNVVRGKF